VAKGYAAVAAVLVQKAALDAKSAIEAIATTFNLTPSELRVLLTIVELSGVPEAADALGIGQATVKTHLHRLFRKTATTRQADLVRLVAGFSSPLVG
jgi:DNA-binding CsgD family transcriptional regulator